ncbi:MAG TPA: hypothetical protein VJS45_08855 [Acidimicrobiia bacterium]|nr:hypothetical protein [Acidimicrobiia bacterium]
MAVKTPSRTVLVALVLALLGTGVLWVVLRPEPGPRRVSVAELTASQEAHDGRYVRTEGVVRRFGPEDGALRLHYVVEDDVANRVKLVGADPAPLVGRAVEVVGRFRFTEELGRFIEVERLAPA